MSTLDPVGLRLIMTNVCHREPDSMPFIRHAIHLLAVALVVMGGAGCARSGPNQRTVKVAVIDAPILYAVPARGEVIAKGWWFGAHDRFKSPNAGSLIAEALARELEKVDGVEVYSREDLLIYMSQKERLLRRRYPSLTSTQRKEVLNLQDPVDYGHSLNVDYVIAPSVSESVTVVNRTFSWWYSHAEANVQVYDVSTGNVVWGEPWKGTGHFSSQLSLFEGYADRVVRDLKRTDALKLERP